MTDLRGSQISMIFQQPQSSLNPVFKVGEQIAEVLRLHMGMNRDQAWHRAGELLTSVGIPDAESRLRSYPHELSGGQGQRGMIAMALACSPAPPLAPPHPATQGLTASIPVLGEVTDRLEVIPGSVPNLINLPPGCRFAPRCRARIKYACTICAEVKPDLVEVKPGHQIRCWLYQNAEGHVAPLKVS